VDDNVPIHCFAPLACPESTLLILGSMPGAASLAAGEYYAHPRNAFWTIIDSVFGVRRELPYAARMQGLSAHGIALWDVLQSCERAGSLDAAALDLRRAWLAKAHRPADATLKSPRVARATRANAFLGRADVQKATSKHPAPLSASKSRTTCGRTKTLQPLTVASLERRRSTTSGKARKQRHSQSRVSR